jgi:hypothetical protein
MQLRNHIAYRFINDTSLAMEMLETIDPNEFAQAAQNKFKPSEEALDKLAGIYRVVSPDDQKAYYITNTVIDKLEMLKVYKKDGQYDWTIFKDEHPCKLTFIMKDNTCLRVFITESDIHFCHLSYRFFKKEDRTDPDIPGQAYWINFYVDRNSGEQCEHFQHSDVQGELETFCYRLLCFFFLSENTERVVNAGKSYGTKKQPDALSNDLNVPVIIVNSCWNVTSIRTEGFNVSGHFRLQPYPSENKTKVIFIQPFKKHGYVRKAAKPE